MFQKFSDYMWHLLHYPLKAKQYASDIYILFVVLGKMFDGVKETALQIPKQANILTATGKYLDLCGNDRNMPRLKNEDDESYRRRLLMKVEIAKRAGTKKGMELAIRSLGYEPEIEPTYKIDPERWAEFYVWLVDSLDSKQIYDYYNIMQVIMEVKQASAKPILGFKYGGHISTKLSQEYRIYLIFTINFFNTIYLYLDNTWEIDGTYVINGIKSGAKKEAFSRVTVSTGVKTTAKYRGTVEIDALWFIDGEYALDGSKCLDGDRWKEDL